MNLELSERDFRGFQSFVFAETGITLSPQKRALVAGRLSKRIQEVGLDYRAYLELLTSRRSLAEVQTAVDLLTTNETYFFREAKHFEVLKSAASSHARGTPFRVWSAASSSGEEAYSIAMVLADTLRSPWQILGTDISSRVLERARRAHYPASRAKHIPAPYLKRFCLRGVREHEGTLLVAKELREHVEFRLVNLDRELPNLGQFEVIFLRNVLIYFNQTTRQNVIQRVCEKLRPGGYLLLGHAETLNDIAHDLATVAPSTYRRQS